jgi:cell division protein FtsL
MVRQDHRHDVTLNSGDDMKPDFDDTSQRVYKVRDFLQLYDREFLQAAYAAILGRKPDPAGEKYYLARIRGGTSRENIIKQLAKSAEAKQHNIVIQGLWWALFVEKLIDVPLLGALLSLMLIVFSAKTRLREMRTLKNNVYGLEYELSHCRETISKQQQMLSDLKQRIETNYLDRENLVHSVPVALRKITRDIDAIRSQLEDTSHA